MSLEDEIKGLTTAIDHLEAELRENPLALERRVATRKIIETLTKMVANLTERRFTQH